MKHQTSTLTALGITTALLLTACGSSDDGGTSQDTSSSGSSAEPTGDGTELTMLIASSGDAETNSVNIAVQDPKLFPLTRGVAGLTSGQLGSGSQFPITMAAGLLMTIPTAVVFIFFQRFFTRGANVGAEKG